MLAELLVARGKELTDALIELGRTGRLHHVDDPTATVIVSSETVDLDLYDVDGPASGGEHRVLSMAGQVVVGNVHMGDDGLRDFLDVRLIAVPQFTMPCPDVKFVRAYSTDELVNSCVGVRCYTIERLAELEEPAQVIVTDSARLSDVAVRAGLALRGASSDQFFKLVAPTLQDQRLLDIDGHLPCDLTARAESVTDMTWMMGLTLDEVKGVFHRLLLNGEAEAERLRAAAVSYRVHEVGPEALVGL